MDNAISVRYAESVTERRVMSHKFRDNYTYITQTQPGIRHNTAVANNLALFQITGRKGGDRVKCDKGLPKILWESISAYQ